MNGLGSRFIMVILVVSMFPSLGFGQEAEIANRRYFFMVGLPAVTPQSFPVVWIDPETMDQDKKNKSPNISYLKVTAGYVEKSVKDFDYSYNYLGLDIETRFVRPQLGIISGYGFGYRKEELHYFEAGHYFNLKMYGQVGRRHYIKVGGGVEWGMPGNHLAKTEFDYRNGNLDSYSHIYFERNATVPFVKVKKSGVIYPVIELVVGEKAGNFIFEIGLRGNIVTFGLEKYDLANRAYEFERLKIAVPSIFVSIGVGI